MVVLIFLLFEIQFSALAEGRIDMRPFDHYSKCRSSKEYFRPNEEQKKELGTHRGLYEIILYECENEKVRTIILGDLVRTHLQVLAISDKSEIEVLEWKEPEKYRLPYLWLKKLNFENQKKVDGYSGATLSVESTKLLMQRAIKIFSWQK